MKKNIFTLLFALMCTITFAQKVIENPYYEVSKSGIHHISKIELNKTETRVHIHNTFLPKWWVQFKKDVFIIDAATGKRYNITRIEGVEFGKKIWMPKSGENTTVLIFPALDENVKKIDYYNLIYGISLIDDDKKLSKTNSVPDNVTKWIDDELAKVTNAPIKDYNSSDFFNKEKAKLIGYIKGYDTRIGFETGIMYVGNSITREDYPIVVKIETDGRFEAELPITNPKNTYVRFDKFAMNLYLEPGQTLAMILDWEEFLLADRFRNKRYQFKNRTFIGPLATINEDLNNFDLKPYNYKSFSKKIKTLTPDIFKKEETSLYQKNRAQLATYLESNTITEKAKVVLENKINLDYATHLFDFASKRVYEAKKDSLNKILKIPVTDTYYNFIKEIDFNNQNLLINDGFSTFVNRFEFSKPILVYPKREKSTFKPEKTFFEYLEDEKIILSKKDKELMENSKNKRFKSIGEYKKHLAAFSESYRNSYKEYDKKYIQKYRESISKKISMEKWRLRDSVVKNTFQLEKNFVYDLVKVRALDSDIKRSDSKNAHEYWETLKKDIDHPFLKEEGERMVNKAFPIINVQQEGLDNNVVTALNMKATVVKLPEGKATEVFRNILDPFKGKIVFVDFWATSCGPCVGSIKRMKETRKEYEGNKDFDFVFITDERSSPLKTYNKFVKEQNLKNINRLSLDDYNYLRQLFKFNGIPRYVVIDKNGDVINNHFPMYNFSSLLDGILEKHK